MARRTIFRTTVAASFALAMASALAACSGPTEEQADAATDVGSAISAERCALNEDAGQVTFLTGYQYQASASILEILAAGELGYFSDLCLDVEIQPGTGDTGQNTQLVASDQVQFTSVSQQDLLTARDNGIELASA